MLFAQAARSRAVVRVRVLFIRWVCCDGNARGCPAWWASGVGGESFVRQGDVARFYGAQPVDGGFEAAERVEMQFADGVLRLGFAVGGEVGEQFVRGAETHQAADAAPVFPQEVDGLADAAGLGVADKRGGAGDAGDAEVYGQGDVARAQTVKPGDDGRELEAELGGEVVVVRVGEGVALFLGFGGFLFVWGDVG